MSETAWFVGDGTLLIQAVEIWLELGHEVAGIASREPGVLAFAQQRSLQAVGPDELGAKARAGSFDYLLSVVNLSLLDAEVIALPRKLAINFHDGYLPYYAGVNVPVWAILEDQARHGVTWHVMTSGADEGDILVQCAFDIAEDETAFSLNAKCFTQGIETFRALATALGSGTLTRTPQQLTQRKYFDFYDRPAQQLLLGFDVDAEALERVARALDFGTYPNPVGTARLLLESAAVSVGAIEVLETRNGAAPGTVLSLLDDGITVASASNDVNLTRLRLTDGHWLDRAALAALGLREGISLPQLDAAAREAAIKAIKSSARSEGFFRRRLAALIPLNLEVGSKSEGEAHVVSCSVATPASVQGHELPALWLAFLARRSGMSSFDVAYADASIEQARSLAPLLLASSLPLRVAVDLEQGLASAVQSIDAARAALGAKFPHASDLRLRRPELARAELAVALLVDVAVGSELPERDLTVRIETQSGRITLLTRSDRGDEAGLTKLARRFEQFLQRASAATQLGRASLLSAEEETLVLQTWNATVREVPSSVCLHELFAAQARRTPRAPAVTARERTLDFQELDRRANAVAHALVAKGAGPDRLVGLYLERGVEMVVALLAVLKAGAAYVPLDPSYPAERIQFMIEDSRLGVLVCDAHSASRLPETTLERITLDEGGSAAGADAPPASGVAEHNLAYVIYTSGSTGKPKGVMVEHRNVVNFLCGMDDVLRPNGSGTWLAVTSLSFDISVLELLWSLTRGLHVVVYPGGAHDAATASRPIDFSVFYFASASFQGPESYRLLFEGARFADENGFVAVWTPERHFHAFGGLYPNPSLTSAALSTITKRVQLRAGSCVSPLHSPLRIAEEWAFVDNVSNGRVGVSFASGWQPNDFVLKPDVFQRRKQQMVEDIETVRKLWRGESVTLLNGLGKEAQVKTLPRPVQAELPIWLTAAGSPETFEEAGRLGANVLTHLLGQTLDDVADKVRRYRAARAQAGHASRGVVTLMLHSYIGQDEAVVKETVRAPMKEYLRSAVGLIKEAAWTFPTFRQSVDDGSFSPNQLSQEELDAVLDHAFERYYRTSALFGTVESTSAFVERVKGIDVDEVACLIDFGVADDLVIAQFPLLARVRERCSAVVSSKPAGKTIAELLAGHAVTHFQCTPSMASMLVLDEASRAGLSRLEHMLVGGEALPLALARDLSKLVSGKLTNVYGPTETTVWSSSHALDEIGDDVPIGRPLANTDLLILDASGALAAPGEQGELAIGGKGVTRGYLGREELTRERFVTHPARPAERLYRSGDLASFREDGVLRFHGRLDQQIKLRGYRIEVGEIEAWLAQHASVRECVVVVREDSPGDKRLVAYVIAKSGASVDAEALRQHLSQRLPEYMLPSIFVALASLPLTPNKKVDRKALPAPSRAAKPVAGPSEQAPAGSLEATIAEIWRELLNRADVGSDDNFFDLGGHSLLTIQVLGRLKPKVERPVSLVDLFRYPTIRSLAAFLTSSQDPSKELEGSATRGAERLRLRRAMMDRRRQ
ncbi:MAG TPA: MupA/Atu3671 family FMN-dependent luciferase-like monooxygenase [Polyangiaceae bacterium]|nr:MupA/Atu3671 family FMN-dependent luciferase-like monooxygenase [Polyangiaceae bacterium]